MVHRYVFYPQEVFGFFPSLFPLPVVHLHPSKPGWDRDNGAVVGQSGWEQFVLLLPLITAPSREVKTSSGLCGEQPVGSGFSSLLPALLQLLAGGKWEPTFPPRVLELPLALLQPREVALLYLPSHLPVQLLCRAMFTRLFARHK